VRKKKSFPLETGGSVGTSEIMAAKSPSRLGSERGKFSVEKGRDFFLGRELSWRPETVRDVDGNL